MAMWMQHVVVILLVGGCLWFVVGQLVRTLRMKSAKAGACCSRGCGAGPDNRPSQRVVFLPAEMVKRR
jgi:hypothetical protein